MIVFPNCKINLGLNIIRKREDGYHDLETIFFPIPYTDVLEVIASENKTEFTISGLPVNTNDNLCIKTYDLFKHDFPQLPEIKMHLHKVIPIGAGLGGGSSDAAFTLLLLNEKFKLKLSVEQLTNYALRLGSDCPFFIINKPSFATGRGEILQQLNIDLTNYKIIIVNPGIHIGTKWAFSKIIPRDQRFSIKEIITQPIKTWKDYLQNDFEVPVFEKYPEIKKIKEDMYRSGAIYASLSGSGSTVYGLFEKNQTNFYKNKDSYFYKVIDFNTDQ